MVEAFEIDRYREAQTFLHAVNQDQLCINVTQADSLNRAPLSISGHVHHQDISHYPNYQPLISACTSYFKRHGVEGCLPENIHVDTSVFTIMRTIFGSELFKNRKNILIPTPTFGHYTELLAPDSEVTFFNDRKADHKIDITKLIERLQTKDKPDILLLMNPVNPTGQIYTEDELLKIATICNNNKIFIVCDEVFADTLPSKSKEIPSIASFMDPDLVFSLSGLKSYGAFGARVSWVYGSKANLTSVFPKNLSGAIAAPMAKYATNIIGQDNQSEMQDYRTKNGVTFNLRISQLKLKLFEINRALSRLYPEDIGLMPIKLITPETTSIALLDFSRLKGKTFLGGNVSSGLDIAEMLHKKANFATVPGEAFMLEPENMTCRVSLSEDTLRGLDNLIMVIKNPQITKQDLENKRSTLPPKALIYSRL